MGTQESILKAAISDRVSPQVRAGAFGMFYMVFGLFWFAGSSLIGLFYELWGVLPVVIFSVLVQGATFLVFLGIFK